jgi:hypothetical protein
MIYGDTAVFGQLPFSSQTHFEEAVCPSIRPPTRVAENKSTR